MSNQEHYATSYQSAAFCAAYRQGVLIVVRLKDGHSTTLNLKQTNEFVQDVLRYEMQPDERDPVDRAANKHLFHMKKQKWVEAKRGDVLTIHRAFLPVVRIET